MDYTDPQLVAWHRRRPFGKRGFEESIALQVSLRAHEEGLPVEAFRKELAQRNGSGVSYFLGNQSYAAPPSRWLSEPQ
jgi:hypothetical protein